MNLRNRSGTTGSTRPLGIYRSRDLPRLPYRLPQTVQPGWRLRPVC